MQIAYKDAINEMIFITEPDTLAEEACLTLIAALFVLPLRKIREDLNKKRALWTQRKEALSS